MRERASGSRPVTSGVLFAVGALVFLLVLLWRLVARLQARLCERVGSGGGGGGGKAKYDRAAAAAFRRRLLATASAEWPGERPDCRADKALFLAYVLLILVDVRGVACWEGEGGEGDGFGGEAGRRALAREALCAVDEVLLP